MRKFLAATSLFLLAICSVASAAPPVADFSVSPNEAVRNSATTFNSTGTCSATPCTYRWTHGDAASTDLIGTGTTASFTYKGPPGTRTVTLTVTDRRNRVAVRTRSFQLVEPSSPPPTAQCSDGRDNDGDALTDYPADPGCSSATDNDETNAAAPPPPPSGGLPGPDNTGVPPGTTLTPSGPITVTTSGAVISGLDITASGDGSAINVNAPNVTIKNTRVRSNRRALIQNNSTGLVVQDSTLANRPVSGQPNCLDDISGGNYIVRRVDMSGCENGGGDPEGNFTLEDSWIHDLDLIGPSYINGNSPHNDGVELNTSAASNVTITGNNIDPVPRGGPNAATSGIIAWNTSGDNVRIEGNWIDGQGASYAIYAPRTAKSAWFINNNHLGRGVFGYTACVKVGNTVTSFAGNIDLSTLAPIGPDNGVGGGCTN